jgi:acyl-CoA thioesterase I
MSLFDLQPEVRDRPGQKPGQLGRILRSGAPSKGCSQITGEPLLFVRSPDGTVCESSLLYQPKRLLQLRMAGSGAPIRLEQVSVAERTVFCESQVPFLSRDELFPEKKSERAIEWHRDKKRFLHFSEDHYFHDLQVLADYETSEGWSGPVPEYQAFRLRGLFQRIAKGSHLRVALLGDSISKGANASGVTNAPPWQPAYGVLFAEYLQQQTGCGVEFKNLSKGGTDSKWGTEQIAAVAEFQPDLTLIAFGMNDAGHEISREVFARNIARIIQELSAHHPQGEYVVISGMSPNPDWHLSLPRLRHGYHTCLQKMAAPGIAFCDVKSSWDFLVKKKGFLSLTGNGVNHPNDFGHLLYAECLAATLFQASELPN